MPGVEAFEAGFAFEDGVSGGDVEGVEFGAGEAEVGGDAVAVGEGEDEVDAAGLVEDLDAHGGGDEEPAIAGGFEAIGAAAWVWICGWEVEVVVGLDVFQQSIGFPEGGPDVAAVGVGDVEAGLVGCQGDAVDAVAAVGAELFFRTGGDDPDGAGVGFGGVDGAVVCDDEVIGLDVRGVDFFGFVGEVPGDDFGGAGAAAVESAIGAEGEAVGVAGVFEEGGDGAVGGDAVDFVVRDIGEEDGAIGSGDGAFGEAVAGADDLPFLAGDEEFLGAAAAVGGWVC